MASVDKIEVKQDRENANRGTPRGHSIIERSIRQHGAGRSGLAAKDGTLLAGNQTFDEMSALGIPIKEVHTTGEEWVVVVRDDVEPGSEQATMMALEDNRSSQLGLDFDPAVLASLSQQMDLSPLWTTEELQEVTGRLTEESKPEQAGLTPPDELEYRIIVECDGEFHQGELLKELEDKGLKCKALIS